MDERDHWPILHHNSVTSGWLWFSGHAADRTLYRAAANACR
jgi:hypothetical protein